MTIDEFQKAADSFVDTLMMPALFVGHGSPMNGVEENVFSKGWKTLGESMPKPTAILSISAHWYVPGTFVHVAEKPRTIHDFYGFPEELYNLSYPCPGAPDVAKDTQTTASEFDIQTDTDWGIDHGTWIVLLRMFPDHNIPVFQLSIDMTKPASYHYELGRALAPLRRKGVLIMGSGNIVHNLGRVNFSPTAPTYDWAQEFDNTSKDLILNNEHEPLVSYEKLGEAARLSIPTPDHYLPLLYILGLKEKNEKVSFPIEGMTLGSISMRTMQIG